mgnify:CR=1 FL=1
MADERILYPCYFNATITRRQGRRVPHQAGLKVPALADIERALKQLGIRFRIEEHHHPAHWMRREGRVIAEWKASKEALIRKVARQMGGKR